MGNCAPLVQQEDEDIVIRHIKGAWKACQTNRYQVPKSEDTEMHHQLLKAEQAFADYMENRFALGVNSGGTALTLILESLKERVDSDIVYTNAFTFNAVPSAIVNAGMTPWLVESTPGLVLDLEDLELQFKEKKGKILMLSYMRGFVPDLDRVVKLCKKYGVLLVEDAAHAYGIEYKGHKIGSFGIAAGVSTQSNKLINTGEGGFIVTNDEDLMARSIIRAGSYEKYWKKHGNLTPKEELIMKYIYSVANASVRLSNVQGAMALAQFSDIEERIDMLNKNHALLSAKLGNVAEVITQESFITRPVYDSIQVRIASLKPGQAEKIQEIVQRTFKFQIFLHPSNARYYGSWKFMDIGRELPVTRKNLENVFDMRLKHTLTESDISDVAKTILDAITQVTGSNI